MSRNFTSRKSTCPYICGAVKWRLPASFLGKIALVGMASVLSVGLLPASAIANPILLRSGSTGTGTPKGIKLAQTPDFPDLPVLEPAMPISAPISVPPIDARPAPSIPASAAPVLPLSVPSLAAPPVLEPISADPDPIEIPVIVSDTALPDASPSETTASASEGPEQLGVIMDNGPLEPVVAEVVIPAVAEPNAPSRWAAPIPFGQPLQ